MIELTNSVHKLTQCPILCLLHTSCVELYHQGMGLCFCGSTVPGDSRKLNASGEVQVLDWLDEGGTLRVWEVGYNCRSRMPETAKSQLARACGKSAPKSDFTSVADASQLACWRSIDS